MTDNLSVTDVGKYHTHPSPFYYNSTAVGSVFKNCDDNTLFFI